MSETIAADTDRRLFRGSRTRTGLLAGLFILLTFVTGLRLALMTPLGEVADEPAHVARAAGLLHGELLGHRTRFRPPSHAQSMIVPVIDVNFGIINAAMGEMGASCTNRAPIAHARAIGWAKFSAIDIDYNTIQYFPALYLPGTLGLEIGRLAGLRPLGALFAGRIAMLLAYAAVGAAAIGVAAFGAELLFALLSLPMAVSLGASFNQDGMLIAVTVLALALLTRDPARGRLSRYLAIALLLLMICSKPPYGLLLFATLVPLSAPRPWRRMVGTAALGLLPAAWVATMILVSMMPFNAPPYHPGPLWPGDPHVVFHTTDAFANLRVLLAHPAVMVTMPATYLLDQAGFLVRSAIGELGWLNIDLSPAAYGAWGAALAIAALGTVATPGDRGLRWHWRDSALVAALVIVTVFAIELAMYLNWDKVGVATLYGMQGRYYLIFVPFLLLILPRAGSALARRIGDAPLALLRIATVLPALAMAMLDTVYLPALIHHVFCLR